MKNRYVKEPFQLLLWILFYGQTDNVLLVSLYLWTVHPVHREISSRIYIVYIGVKLALYDILNYML